jgi:CRISPR-associated protein Csd1
MIIQALVDHYDRLEKDPESDIASLGYSYQQVSFEIVLSPDGSSYEIHDIRKMNGKQSRPSRVIVLGQSKRSSALNPYFLWDNPQYTLGYKLDDPKPERSRKACIQFRDQHLKYQSEIDSVEYDAVCRFLQDWNIDRLSELDPHLECLTNFGVFRIQGSTRYVHECPKVLSWWNNTIAHQEKEESSPNMLTGKIESIARIHYPKIKLVRGAQSSGAFIVSFNKDAYKSYGKQQGSNSPISSADAFKYCTVLNAMTSNEHRRLFLGDMTLVFWSQKPSSFENELLQFMSVQSSKDTPIEDIGTIKSIKHTLSALSKGKQIEDIDPSTSFYILGLAPNASRLSVRLWLTSTIGELASRLYKHLEDLALEPIPDRASDLSIRRIIAETVPPKGGWPDEDAISPLLAGSVLRAILTGSAYPRALLSGVVSRVRTEGFVYDKEKRKDSNHAQHRRCAIIKACILRDARVRGVEKDIPVSLNPDHPETSYQLGRLFATLEKIQQDAHPGLNATIKDRYFGASCATPGTIFPRLLKLHQHHIAKLDGGHKVIREKLVQSIVGNMTKFPTHQNLEDQGLFTIGYYHQRQDFFTKKIDNDQ